MSYGTRPTGVTVLAVLAIFMVLACLITVALFLFVSGLSENPDFIEALRSAGIDPGIIDNISLMMTAYALLYAGYAAIYALLAYSFLVGAQWGWGLGVFFAIFLIVFGIAMFIVTPSTASVPGLVFQLIIDVIILYYINTPPVIAWFKGPGGKGLFGSGTQLQGQY